MTLSNIAELSYQLPKVSGQSHSNPTFIIPVYVDKYEQWKKGIFIELIINFPLDNNSIPMIDVISGKYEFLIERSGNLDRPTNSQISECFGGLKFEENFVTMANSPLVRLLPIKGSGRHNAINAPKQM